MAKKKKIMIVDDSKTLRKIVCFAVEKVFSFDKPLEAEDGLEGLHKLSEEEDIDLILLDVNMPKMNGLEFLEKVRKDSSRERIPIVMLSTENKDIDKDKALTLGSDAYLEKPFAAGKLKGVIDEIFDKKKDEKEESA